VSAPLAALPLTAERFAPFGELIQLNGSPSRFDKVLDNGRPQARPNLDVSLRAAHTLPLRAERMERHLFSSQSFLPLDATSYLLLVAPAGGEQPDLCNPPPEAACFCFF